MNTTTKNMEFKTCEKCGEYHDVNRECDPAFIVTETDTGICGAVHGVSHWHAARNYIIQKWINIENVYELFKQPKIIVDVVDTNNKSERYILSVEFCAQQVKQDK